MKRSFALLLAVPVAALAYACSSSSSGGGNNPGTDGGNPNPGSDGGNPSGQDGSTPPTDGGQPGTDGSVPTTTNPIQGIATPALVVGSAGFVNGLRLFNSLLYANDPTAGNGAGVEFTVDPTNGNSNVVRATSNGAVGIAIDSKHTVLMTTETSLVSTDGGLIGDVIRLFPDGGTGLIANSWTTDAGTTDFDSPNDLTMRKSDGTIFVTDPGFQNNAVTNHVFKISPTNVVTMVDECTDTCRQNGIAISPDEKTLYVGYTYFTGAPTTPYIKKFTIATDGSLSGGTKFADVGTDLDGFAIDDNGNVYASYQNGVAVFAPSGTKWGEIAVPGNTAGSAEPGVLAFGGTARTTLYIGTGPGESIYSVTVKVPGRVE